jgi:hypothetical protein
MSRLHVAAGVVIALALGPERAESQLAPAPSTPLRYTDVQPIFEQHCASCHDARQSKNEPAMRVFEMSSYPFATQRPATLLRDLRATLPKRKLSEADAARGVTWIDGGALDAAGLPPRWR